MAKSSLDIFLLDTLLYLSGKMRETVLEKGKCEQHREAEGKTSNERNREGRIKDWGVAASSVPINQHRSKGLGLSSYTHTHTHTHTHTQRSVSPIIKCPVVRVSDYKVPNWLFVCLASESITLPPTEDPASWCSDTAPLYRMCCCMNNMGISIFTINYY